MVTGEPPPDADTDLDEYMLDGLWQAIKTSADFVAFALAFQDNWRGKGAQWTIRDLDGLLRALGEFAEHDGPMIDGFDGGLWRNPWQIMAMLLFGSRKWSEWMRTTTPTVVSGLDLDEYAREGLFQLIDTYVDFVGFARSLRAHWQKDPLRWHNATVDDYLGAIARTAERWGATLEAIYGAPPCRPWTIVAALLDRSRVALGEPL